MNVENILAVANAIEKHTIPDLGFNMGVYCLPAGEIWGGDKSGHNCGTVACIAGWANFISGKTPFSPLPANSTVPFFQRAQDWLELEDDHAFALFIPDELDRLSDTHAVAVLRHLAETGEVDWSIGAPSPVQP